MHNSDRIAADLYIHAITGGLVGGGGRAGWWTVAVRCDKEGNGNKQECINFNELTLSNRLWAVFKANVCCLKKLH